MSIRSLDGISDDVLNAPHATEDGKSYTLNYSEQLTAQAQFKGKGKSNANAQGWERNSIKYYKELEAEHPEMFSRSNSKRIANHQSPIVDQRMIQYNPQFKDYKEDTLIVHHIGGDGEVTAIPHSMHKGYGGVHNEEKAVGITGQCKDFSEKCQRALEKDPNLKSASREEMRNEVEKMEWMKEIEEENKRKIPDIPKQNERLASNQRQSSKSKASPRDRGDAVASRSAKSGKGISPNAASQARGRAISTGKSGQAPAPSPAQSGAQGRGAAIAHGGASHGSGTGHGSGASHGNGASGGGKGASQGSSGQGR